ncbi:hypothetical protein HDU98_007709 [Podochytrium sp. JEL0797]|nr:hypothetical protein HDU98_007709 [Podochytrium sp. JEL0797]
MQDITISHIMLPLLLTLIHLPSILGAACFPAPIINQTYLQGDHAGFNNHNYVFLGNYWTNPVPCNNAATTSCYPGAQLASADYPIGSQTSVGGQNFIMREFGEWYGLGACAPTAPDLSHVAGIGQAVKSCDNGAYQCNGQLVQVCSYVSSTFNAWPNAFPTMFAGVNSYFFHTLPPSTQTTLLAALQSAGIKTIRIFITSFSAGGKGTDSLGTNDLELDTVSVYNDNVLHQLDALMALVVQYGIKLQITMHDRWNLDNTWGICDAYCQAFCKGGSDLTGFYNNQQAFVAFDARLAHIVNHVNVQMGNRAWKDIPEAIYAFEIENEAQGTSNGVSQFTNADWWCERATVLRGVMGGSSILIATGGGQDFYHSLISQNFACAAMDVVALHSYSNSIADVQANLNTAQQMRQQSGKIVIFEEFGATSGKGDWIAQIAQVAIPLGIPFMPWEYSSVSVANDYEFSTDDPTTMTALAQVAQQALAA